MSTKYSKKIVKKMIEGDDGKVRKYSALKLSAIEVAVEGFKLLRAATPSFGVAIDQLMDKENAFDTPDTFAAMLQLLTENLTPEHFTDLVDKNLGSLMFDGKEIEDWSEHFDDYEEDFLTIIIWLSEENFTSFFMKSITPLPCFKKLTSLFPSVKEKVTNALSGLKQEYKDE